MSDAERAAFASKNWKRRLMTCAGIWRNPTKSPIY